MTLSIEELIIMLRLLNNKYIPRQFREIFWHIHPCEQEIV